MKFVFILFYLMVTVNATPEPHTQCPEWKNFKLRFGILFRNETAEKRRFRFFTENREMIYKHNQRYAAGNTRFKMSICKYSDLPNEEFVRVMNGYVTPMERRKREVRTIPETIHPAAESDEETAKLIATVTVIHSTTNTTNETISMDPTNKTIIERTITITQSNTTITKFIPEAVNTTNGINSTSETITPNTTFHLENVPNPLRTTESAPLAMTPTTISSESTKVTSESTEDPTTQSVEITTTTAEITTSTPVPTTTSVEQGMTPLESTAEPSMPTINVPKPVVLATKPVTTTTAKPTAKLAAAAPTTTAVPVAAIDWRAKGAVTAVKDQGLCGSCWSFASTGALEGRNFIKTGKLVTLSEQNLIDCTSNPKYGNSGCDGGWMGGAFSYVVDNNGIDTNASYPYKGALGTCSFNAANVGGTATGSFSIPSGNEQELMKAVAKYGPIASAIDASLPSFQHYSSGIYFDPNCTTNIDHAVLVVGFGTIPDGTDYWIVKNTWGSSWGEQGYFRLVRNRNNHCGIATAAICPT